MQGINYCVTGYFDIHGRGYSYFLVTPGCGSVFALRWGVFAFSL
jgi:hypothetical protein